MRHLFIYNITRLYRWKCSLCTTIIGNIFNRIKTEIVFSYLCHRFVFAKESSLLSWHQLSSLKSTLLFAIYEIRWYIFKAKKIIIILFHAGGDICRLSFTFANSLEPDQARQKIGSSLNPNCLAFWYLFETVRHFDNYCFRKIFYLKKVSRRHEILPSMKYYQACKEWKQTFATDDFSTAFSLLNQDDALILQLLTRDCFTEFQTISLLLSTSVTFRGWRLKSARADVFRKWRSTAEGLTTRLDEEIAGWQSKVFRKLTDLREDLTQTFMKENRVIIWLLSFLIHCF